MGSTALSNSKLSFSIDGFDETIIDRSPSLKLIVKRGLVQKGDTSATSGMLP